MLVLQINGEPLPLSQGYPVQYWQGGISAGSFVRHLKTIVVTAEENPITVAQVSCGTPDPSTGVFFNKPNVGFQTYAEGQIFPMEQPITFEGWTDAFDQTITAMEFSMDMGATWTRYDIENADVDRWVYWYFTYTPEETGSYCLRVRAYTQEGLVTDKNIDLLFHVK